MKGMEMRPTNQEIINKLDILYNSDNRDQYDKQIEMLKGVGYRIFRNSDGKHKVEYNTHYFQQMFGGTFKGII